MLTHVLFCAYACVDDTLSKIPQLCYQMLTRIHARTPVNHTANFLFIYAICMYVYIYTVRMGSLNLGTCGHCGGSCGKLLHVLVLRRSLSVGVTRHVTYTSETAGARRQPVAARSATRRCCLPGPDSARQSAPPCFVRAAPTVRPARLPDQKPATAVR